MKKILTGMFFSVFLLLGHLGAQNLEEGIRQLENENYAAALNTFNAICKADPKNVDAYYWMGEVYYRQDRYAEAEAAYRKGIEFNSDCAACNVGLLKLALDKKDQMGEDKYVTRAVAINKKDASIYGLIGDAYLYGKNPNYAKAIEYLTKARDLSPKTAIYWAHLGDAHAPTDNGQAMSAYERAVELDPSNAEAYIAMARIWKNANQEDLAIPRLEKAIQMSPGDARPIKDLYELYIQTGEYDKALPLLKTYTSLVGDDIDAKVRLVKFLVFQAKDYETAIPEGEKLLLSHPDQYTLHRWLQWAYVGQAKNIENAKEEGQTIDAAKVASYWQKAYEHSVKLFEALNADQSRQGFPEDYDYYALSALKTGKLNVASKIYEDYIRFDPARAPDIYVILAKTYYDSSDYVQAINFYNKKDALKPLTVTEEYYRALAYYHSKQNTEADSSFARILRATPNYAQGHFYRARIANRIDSTGTLHLAMPHYMEYIRLAEADIAKNKNGLVEAYMYMGAYEVHNDRIDSGKAYFEKVLAIKPDHETAREYLKTINEQDR